MQAPFTLPAPPLRGLAAALAVVLAGTLLLVGASVPAEAEHGEPEGFAGETLERRGPVDAFDEDTNPDGHNYPVWYEDREGLRLELCLDEQPAGACLVEEPDPAGFEGNHGEEAFYWAADVEDGVEGHPFSVGFRLNLEAAYAENADPECGEEGNPCFQRGDEVVFARFRLRVTGIDPGETYEVVHPMGEHTFEASDGAPRHINRTHDDICVFEFGAGDEAGEECRFDIPLDSPILGPFLTWDTFGLPESEGGPPEGFIGTPTEPHTINPGPHMHDGEPVDFFRISGPGIPVDNCSSDDLDLGSDEGCFETDQFLVMGKVASHGPTVPRAVTAEATGDDTAQVSWLRPIYEGEAGIADYELTADPVGDAGTVQTQTVAGDPDQARDDPISTTFTGLTKGETYTVTVVARSNESEDVPEGDELSPPATSNEFVVGNVPGAPTNVTATAGDASATVEWTASTADPETPVTGYTVISDPEGHTATVDGDTTTATLGGLTNDTTYTFDVVASNVVGDSAPGTSNAVTPTAPEDEAPEDEVPEDEVPEDEAPEDEAPEDEAPEDEAPDDDPLEPGAIQTACPKGEVPPHGFTDVDGNVHEDALGCLLWYGITQGITPTTYGPAMNVTRDQMASFMMRTIEATDAELPAPSDQGFADIDGNVHADAINQLAEIGVVLGFSEDTYGPREEIRRDQMTAFLVRAHEFVTEEGLSAARDFFGDDDGNVHETNINKAAQAGFTVGTSSTTFAPSQPVRRDQMGSFLVRMLNVLVSEGHATTPM